MSILRSNNNPKFAFLYLFSLVALLFVALGSGQVIFQAINKYIADLGTSYQGAFNPSMLKFAISSLLIAIPVYYLTAAYLERSLRKGELDKDSAIRRWLIYFILFVSSVVMLIWLIITIGNFLDGELTSKFILKAITAILIAGIVFSYYLYDIRRDSISKKDMVVRAYLIGSLIICVGALAWSFFFVESPAEARARRQDALVLEHFTQLDSAFNSYYNKTQKLPDSIEQGLSETPYLLLDSFKHPVNGQPYEYKKIDDTTYELCAEFQTNNRQTENQGPYVYADRWPHDTGYQCLRQKAVDYNSDQGGALKPVPIR